MAAAIVVAMFALAHGFTPRLLDELGLRKLGVRSVALGAIIGTYSHVLLDSLMHADMHPFAPFSDRNPLLGAVFLNTLHGFCLLAGVVGAIVIGARRYFRS